MRGGGGGGGGGGVRRYNKAYAGGGRVEQFRSWGLE